MGEMMTAEIVAGKMTDDHLLLNARIVSEGPHHWRVIRAHCRLGGSDPESTLGRTRKAVKLVSRISGRKIRFSDGIRGAVDRMVLGRTKFKVLRQVDADGCEVWGWMEAVDA